MKKIIASVLVLASLNVWAATHDKSTLLPKPTQSVKPLNRVLVVVNGEPVTQNQFNAFYDRALVRLKQSNHPVPANQKGFRQYILNQYILRVLQLQIAQRGHVVITDQQVDQQIKKMIKEQHTTLPKFQQKLQLDGYSFADFKQEVKAEMTIGILQRQALGSKIEVTDAQIAALRAKIASDPHFATRYHVVDILTPLGDKPTVQQLKAAFATSKEMKAHLEKGASYKEVADHNDTDLGWRALNDMPDLFAAAVPKLKKLGVAGPIRAANGYHVIQLIDIKKAARPMPSKKELTQHVYMTEMQKALGAWLKKMHSEATIIIVHPV